MGRKGQNASMDYEYICNQVEMLASAMDAICGQYLDTNHSDDEVYVQMVDGMNLVRSILLNLSDRIKKDNNYYEL